MTGDNKFGVYEMNGTLVPQGPEGADGVPGLYAIELRRHYTAPPKDRPRSHSGSAKKSEKQRSSVKRPRAAQKEPRSRTPPPTQAAAPLEASDGAAAAAAVPAFTAATPAAPVVERPYLEGTLAREEDGSISMKGRWAMHQSDILDKTKTSQFEYKLQPAYGAAPGQLPVDGTLDGFFSLRRTAGSVRLHVSRQSSLAPRS